MRCLSAHRYVQLLLALACNVLAQIRIHSPSSLAKHKFVRQSKAGYIQGSTATFGAPYYGLRVMGRIVYAPSKGDDYCQEGDYKLPASVTPAPEKEEDGSRRQINIVLIKRGQSKCRFVTKVKVAEKHKNAQAVIIIDKEGNSERDVTKLIMADDGNLGSNIKVPSILVNWNDGQKLIESIENGGPVIAELVWDIPVNNIVTMDIWMSVTNREAIEFLRGFSNAAEQLAYNLKVVPHYHIFSLPSGQDFEHMCTSSDGK